jgi:hypothetical protein
VEPAVGGELLKYANDVTRASVRDGGPDPLLECDHWGTPSMLGPHGNLPQTGYDSGLEDLPQVSFEFLCCRLSLSFFWTRGFVPPRPLSFRDSGHAQFGPGPEFRGGWLMVIQFAVEILRDL